MEQIDDLNSAREVLSSNVPDPFGSIADHDLLFRAAPTTFPSFQIDTLAKFLRRFNGAHVRGRIGIADRIALLIASRLRERTPQLGFSRVGRLPFRFAGPALRFLFHYRHSGGI